MLARPGRDLRTLANAESGTLTLQKEPTDLAMLTHDVVDAFRAEARSGRRRRRRGRRRADLPLVDVDPLRIREVLMNLLSNALRHTPPAAGHDCGAAPADRSVVSEGAPTPAPASPRRICRRSSIASTKGRVARLRPRPDDRAQPGRRARRRDPRREPGRSGHHHHLHAAVPERQTRRSRSAARSSVSSFFAKQNRSTGGAGRSVRNGDVGNRGDAVLLGQPQREVRVLLVGDRRVVDQLEVGAAARQRPEARACHQRQEQVALAPGRTPTARASPRRAARKSRARTAPA